MNDIFGSEKKDTAHGRKQKYQEKPSFAGNKYVKYSSYDN